MEAQHLMYGMTFRGDYAGNMPLNQRYEAIGALTFRGLNSPGRD